MKKLLILCFATLLLYGCAERTVNTGFESVKFHTSVCFGACPAYHMEIDKDKNIKLFAEKVFLKGAGRDFMAGDTAKTGYFTGVVSDTTFTKLIKAITAEATDTATWEKADCCDGSTKTIIIYYDGKRKYLKSMFPPESANNLIQLLYEAAEKSKLVRTDKKFEIEE